MSTGWDAPEGRSGWTTQPSRRGRAWVIGALVILALGVGVWALGRWLLNDRVTDPTAELRDATGRIVAGGDADMHWLHAGDCYSDPRQMGAEGEVSTLVSVFPCAEPHHFEIIGVRVGEPRLYPGDEEATAQASELCRSALTGYVGVDPDHTTLLVSTLTPNSLTWNSGDRVLLCVATRGEASTGSLKGSKA